MPVTRDDVVWCYVRFLGRSPESDAVIQQHIDAVADLRGLVERFVGSAEYLQRPTTGSTIDGFVYNDMPGEQQRVLEILKMLEPVTIEGARKLRVGGSGDGGYVMLDDFAGVTAAYSLGINDDVSWDLDIAKRSIEVFQYDHTIEALPARHKLFHWFKVGIAAEPRAGFDSLPNLIKANGHAAAGNLILKCDIEGTEWDMFAAMRAEDLARFSQIVVEFHGFHFLVDPAFAKRARAAIANLTRQHRLIHVHANNNSALSIIGGVPIAASMEMSFVRVAGKRFVRSQETFPTPLDEPCYPHRADYCLGTFRFS